MAELSVREVARLLGVAEKTIWRWVRTGEIPHTRLREDVLFNRVELQEWALSSGHPLPPEAAGKGPSEGLVEAVARGGIARDLPGQTREEVLAAVAMLPGVPAGVDRALLKALLLSRERLGSTGLGDGLAFPHPRDPLVLGASSGPAVLVAFLARPVDFGAVDSRPVSTLFTILTPTVQAHLATLSRLAYVLHDEELRQLISVRAPDAAILGRIRAAEEALAAARAGRGDPEEDEA